MAGAVACRGRMLMRTCQRGGGGICLGVSEAASESKQPAGLGISPDTIFSGDSEYYSDLASLSRTLRVRVLNVLWQRRPQVGRKNLVLAVRVTVRVAGQP